ncbi:MAG: PAN domain-containing protein [Pseudomonadota bacterium]
MRVSLLIAATIAFAHASIADDHAYSHEQKTYRYGGTYKVVTTNNATDCATSCEYDGQCKAWSFQRETAGLGLARCELKNTIGEREENALMISGISPRLSNYGNASTAESDGSELLGGTSAGITIPTLRPTITSANAHVAILGTFDGPSPTTRARLP